MIRPQNLKTKIFLDSGDPAETQRVIELLGFLDGQTTNPSLVAKNPEVKKRLERGEKFREHELLDFYKHVVQEISNLMPSGSVSIEVPADATTEHEELFTFGELMFQWIPNAHIKYPTTLEGLKAAEKTVGEGMRVNMTLCFLQSQAAAVHGATRGAKRGDVYLSPFVGRLDDRGIRGIDLIKNIAAMYKAHDSHVEILVASTRNVEHLYAAFALGADIVTAPFSVLEAWAQQGMRTPENFEDTRDLQPISFEEYDLAQKWHDFEIDHELTRKGLEQFSQDWSSLIE